MADHELNTNHTEYDELDRALAARPPLHAPRTTRANVMARLATLPQTQTNLLTLDVPTARYAVPPLTYDRPGILPDFDLAAFQPEPDERQQRRLLAGFIFTGAWAGACVLLVWLLWPAVSNLIFGPSTDLDMQTRLAALQAFWNGLGSFVANYGSQWPAALSAVVGLVVMLVLFYDSSPRRNFTTR